MIKQIISNELENRFNRPANNSEILSAIDYLSDWLADTKRPTMADIIVGLDAFVHDNYIRCDICDEMHPSDDMTNEYGAWCCNNSLCLRQAKEDFEFDSHLEWGTDSRHSF